jgi:hypothetical protein
MLACTIWSCLACDDVLPGSLSAGSRVSGREELEVERGVRMCMYLFDCFFVALRR